MYFISTRFGASKLNSNLIQTSWNKLGNFDSDEKLAQITLEKQYNPHVSAYPKLDEGSTRTSSVHCLVFI